MSVVDAPPEAGCLRVLLVDDAADLRLLFRTFLERAGGFTVVGEASDGAEAVLVAGRLQPDLVLLDLAMPVMGGLEAIPPIRKVAAATKIVVFSGFADARLADEVRALGAHGLVEKSAHPATIVDALLAAAGDTAPTRPAPTTPPASRILTDVTDRTAEITELSRVRAELERSNRELAELAYVTSHDLGEPLRVINGFARLLADDCAEEIGPKGSEYVGFIIGGAARMQDLIDDLLEYSRAGTSGPLESVALAAVAQEVLSLLDVAETDGIVEIGDLPIVTWNVTAARQVLQNLLANALKFTRPGASPHVRVSAGREPGGWTLEVADNGIGIEPTRRERAFRMFQRLNRREEYPGSGIGLAICKKVIEQRGGDVAITDTPGGGTTVRFTVPDTEVGGTS